MSELAVKGQGSPGLIQTLQGTHVLSFRTRETIRSLVQPYINRDK
jgi:hypothetical protein